MAEDEIRKHTKAAFKILKDKESNWQHKLKEILLEVLIIVFAVTISIWFHNYSDKLHERREQTVFLIGLKKDLRGDIENLKSSLSFYENSLKGIRYFRKVGAGDSLKKDSLLKYGDLFFSWTEIEPHNSRYEALKSSGKLGIVENSELLNNIISLNESTVGHIQILNRRYLDYSDKTAAFIEEHAEISQPGGLLNIKTLVKISQMRLLMNYGYYLLDNNIIPAHIAAVKKCEDIIKQIDEELK